VDVKRALLQTLDDQRDHAIGILDGLDDAALRRPVLPTGWTCAALVQHLALDIERFWFAAVMAGELQVPGVDEIPGSAWELDPGLSPQAALSRYRVEIERANRIIGDTPLDQAPAAWPDAMFGDFRLPDLQAVLLHVITETACHAGHLDAARELLDGRTWLILE
jgi:hypothetical protein